MSAFDILLASRIRECMPEIAYGRVDSIFDDQLADIIRQFREDYYGDSERDKRSDEAEAGVQREDTPGTPHP